VRGAPGYTRLVREQADRSAFFGALSLAALPAGLAVTLAGTGAGHGSAVVLLVLSRPPWWIRPHVFAAKAMTYRRPPEA
jgi:hypothetical protein